MPILQHSDEDNAPDLPEGFEVDVGKNDER
jgi:hypothetical protein